MPSPRKSCRWKSDGSSLTCADCGWITVDPEVIMSIACKVGFSVTSAKSMLTVGEVVIVLSDGFFKRGKGLCTFIRCLLQQKFYEQSV
jgi:hypothetical protein